MFKVGMLIRSKINPRPIYRIINIDRKKETFDCCVVVDYSGELNVYEKDTKSSYFGMPLSKATVATKKDRVLVRKLRTDYKKKLDKISINYTHNFCKKLWRK